MKVLPLFDAISKYETNGEMKDEKDLTLDLSNIITLLVAAEYLKMDKLREECIGNFIIFTFITTHLIQTS